MTDHPELQAMLADVEIGDSVSVAGFSTGADVRKLARMGSNCEADRRRDYFVRPARSRKAAICSRVT